MLCDLYALSFPLNAMLIYCFSSIDPCPNTDLVRELADAEYATRERDGS